MAWLIIICASQCLILGHSSIFHVIFMILNDRCQVVMKSSLGSKIRAGRQGHGRQEKVRRGCLECDFFMAGRNRVLRNGGKKSGTKMAGRNVVRNGGKKEWTSCQSYQRV